MHFTDIILIHFISSQETNKEDGGPRRRSPHRQHVGATSLGPPPSDPATWWLTRNYSAEVCIGRKRQTWLELDGDARR